MPNASLAARAPKPINIFRPGRFTAMTGESIDFDEAALRAIATNYDPAKHEAPLVIGHPAQNLPAWGWVGGVDVSATGALQILPRQVDAQFAEMVNDGKFKKVSASFYKPACPFNPTPGSFYLKHVGFLGAQAPALKGLGDASFGEGEALTIEFAEFAGFAEQSLRAQAWGFETVSNVFRRLREWLIADKGLDVADQVLPEYQIGAVDEAAVTTRHELDAPRLPGTPMAFAETPLLQGASPMSTADQARLAQLEAENTRIAAELTAERAAHAAAQGAARRAQRHTAHVSFCEGLTTQGRMLPVNLNPTVEFMHMLDAQTAKTLSFAEGDQTKQVDSLDWFKAFMEKQPKVVEFSELAGGTLKLSSDADSTAIAHQALEFQEAESKAGRTVNSAQAVARVLQAPR